jgi:translocator protein
MANPTRKMQLLGLIGWFTACFLTGGIGAIASVNAATFYAQLFRPSWAPPAWLFGPVWSALYFLMALAAWLVWRKHGFAGAGFALKLFIAQLLVNALWSWLFFAWHLGAIAFTEIILLWLIIVATIRAFWYLHRAAALLMAPYLAWVSFATVLAFAMWRLNPTILG